MAIYPGAFYVPIDKHMTADRLQSTFTKVVLHTAVSNSRSLEGQFREEGVCSHFYVDRSGNVEQYIDTRYKSNAQLEGNTNGISIETWDGQRKNLGPITDFEINQTGWNWEQVYALGRLINWACVTHKIPFTLMKNSLPSTKGIGYHRLGVDPWRVDGGEKWSGATGKICPGEARIEQIPGLIDIAKDVPSSSWAPVAPLRIDGSLGPKTIARWQEVMGTPVSTNATVAPVSLVKAVQQHLNSRGAKLVVDGYGIYQDNNKTTDTAKALQRYLGLDIDGVISAPVSQTIYALQDRLTKAWF